MLEANSPIISPTASRYSEETIEIELTNLSILFRQYIEAQSRICDRLQTIQNQFEPTDERFRLVDQFLEWFQASSKIANKTINDTIRLNKDASTAIKIDEYFSPSYQRVSDQANIFLRYYEV